MAEGRQLCGEEGGRRWVRDVSRSESAPHGKMGLEMEPLLQAWSYFRRRKFQLCADLCSQLLEKSPGHQVPGQAAGVGALRERWAGWRLRTQAHERAGAVVRVGGRRGVCVSAPLTRGERSVSAQ